jgi:hypothetical protein
MDFGGQCRVIVDSEYMSGLSSGHYTGCIAVVLKLLTSHRPFFVLKVIIILILTKFGSFSITMI